MKLFLLVVVLASTSALQLRRKPEWDSDWETFKGRHGKKYGHVEESVRRSNWEQDREKIEKHNADFLAGKHGFSMALNHLSDWSAQEKQKLLSARIPHNMETTFVEDVPVTERATLPDSVDYRNNTCLTAVRDQSTCGSCWAFTATAVLEFQLCKKLVKQVSLSEQQLVDCASAYGNYGCDGGWYVNAWQYVKAAPGQTALTNYPYTKTNGTCKYDTTTSVGTTIGASYIAKANATAIQTIVATRGPVATSLDVVDSFYSYSTGVYSSTLCSKDANSVNHGVVIVGYGTSGTTPYWIVRNSWGSTWGLKGYILVKRGENMCNIETWAAYPTV